MQVAKPDFLNIYRKLITGRAVTDSLKTMYRYYLMSWFFVDLCINRLSLFYSCMGVCSRSPSVVGSSLVSQSCNAAGGNMQPVNGGGCCEYVFEVKLSYSCMITTAHVAQCFAVQSSQADVFLFRQWFKAPET